MVSPMCVPLRDNRDVSVKRANLRTFWAALTVCDTEHNEEASQNLFQGFGIVREIRAECMKHKCRIQHDEYVACMQSVEE